MLQRLQERPAYKELSRIELVLEVLPILPGPERLGRPDMKELADIIPLIDGLVDVYTLVAL
jgi:hypothetical protein